MLIYENANFTVEAPDHPHVDRKDGGHIKISPKTRVTNRQKLSAKLAIELMRLTIVVGKAMTDVMNKHGVDIGIINYQDNSNWTALSPEGPYCHYHLYGRAKSAKYHKYGHVAYFPLRKENPEYYERFKPLNKKDINEIAKEITRLMNLPEYSNSVWGLE